VFERFTERARQALIGGQEEARELRTGHVGSEALRLGLLRDEDWLAARALASFGVTLDRARAQVVRRVSAGEDPAPSGQIPFTPSAKQVLERALQEGLKLGHNYLGTEHFLLGIAEVDEGLAIEVLRDFDLDSQKIRDGVIGLLSGGEVQPETQHGRTPAADAALARQATRSSRHEHGGLGTGGRLPD
jgi:ATP-dependent Clp protease ATP-binding subunit ClpC